MNKIVECVLEADLRCQHDGLARQARKQKKQLLNLAPGQHVIFINKRMDRLKMMSAGGVLSYLKVYKGKINLEAIKLIPAAFNNGDIELAYARSLTSVIKGKLKG